MRTGWLGSRIVNEECWAIALGGTRRAYIAEGGVLESAADLDAYFEWVEAAQMRLLDDFQVHLPRDWVGIMIRPPLLEE